MDLRHLRYFVAIADAGGVSRAAARLNISQPALSRQIRDLETELGLSLFDRRRGRLILTGEGQDLLARSRRLLNDTDSFRQRAAALRDGDEGVIRVGVAPVTLESLLPPFLSFHRHRHPGVEVRLVEDSPDHLWRSVERGELTVAISFPGHEGLGSRLLFPVCALAVMASNSDFGRRAIVDVADLAEERLLLLSPRFLTRQWFDAACRRAHLRPNIVLESTAPHVLIALARVGYGIAAVPSHVPFERDGLRAIPLRQDGKALGAWAAIAWDPHRFQPPFVQRFIDELAAYAHRFRPGRGLVSAKVLAAIPTK